MTLERYKTMDTILLIISVLGLGAIAITAYVFMVASRSHVTESRLTKPLSPLTSAATVFIPRSPHDRRQLVQLGFPITLGGLLVPEERRILGERRVLSA